MACIGALQIEKNPEMSSHQSVNLPWASGAHFRMIA